MLFSSLMLEKIMILYYWYDDTRLALTRFKHGHCLACSEDSGVKYMRLHESKLVFSSLSIVINVHNVWPRFHQRCKVNRRRRLSRSIDNLCRVWSLCMGCVVLESQREQVIPMTYLIQSCWVNSIGKSSPGTGISTGKVDGRPSRGPPFPSMYMHEAQIINQRRGGSTKVDTKLRKWQTAQFDASMTEKPCEWMTELNQSKVELVTIPMESMDFEDMARWGNCVMVVYPLSNHESCPFAGKYRFTSPSRVDRHWLGSRRVLSILWRMKLADGLRKRSCSYVVCCMLL